MIDRSILPKAILAGFLLALLGIGLFALVWNVMADVAQFPRLIAALCIPPALMGLIVGAYVLIVRPGQPALDDEDPTT